MKIIRIGLMLVILVFISACDRGASTGQQVDAQSRGQTYESKGFQITLPDSWTIWVDKAWPEGYTQVVAQSDKGISLYLDIYDMSQRDAIPGLSDKMKAALSFILDHDEDRNNADFEIGVADFGFSKGMFTRVTTSSRDFVLEGYLHEGKRYAAFLLFETPSQYHGGFEATAAAIYSSIRNVETN